MNRLDESESTPKKRNLRQDETVGREAITKSGRKVKRPAHLASPEQAPSASPSVARKSVAARVKKAVEPTAVTPSKQSATKELDSPEEVKRSRKTAATSSKTISEQLDTPKRNKAKQQPPNTDDDGSGISKSGRKIKIPAKLMEFESDVLSSPRKNVASEQNDPENDKLAKTPGRSRLNVEQHQHPEEEKEKNPAVRKTPGRRAKSVVPDQLEESSVRTPKRRGVSSLFHEEAPAKSAVVEPTHTKTPGKRVAKTLPGCDVKASPKTPRSRAKSAARGKEATADGQYVSETVSDAYKNKTQTAGRRVGKSMVNPVEQMSRTESSDLVQGVPKTPGRRVAKSTIASAVTTMSVESPVAHRPSPKATARRQRPVAVDNTDLSEENKNVRKTDGRKLVDENHSNAQMADTEIESEGKNTPAEEPVTRSGRKIKPKKMFDFEHEEKLAEQESIDGRRKRKVDTTADDATKSPTKKKMIENVGDQTPKLKSLPESNVSLSGADSSVSRSGRKIKPKKMFEFLDDGETTTSFVHITGCSPTLNEEPDEANDKETGMSAMGAVEKDKHSTKIKTACTPTKQTTSSAFEPKPSPRPMDQNMEELMEELDQQQTFITIRRVNDHHHLNTKVLEEQQHVIDETDRVMISSEPMIIRTSIGFGKPTAARKQTLSEADDYRTVAANITPSRTDGQVVGSSRSGRKIKPKKFFDTDDLATVSHQSISTAKLNQSVPLPTVLSPKPQVVEKQASEIIDNVAVVQEMNSEEGIDIPEGPVEFVNEAAAGEHEGDEEQNQQTMKPTGLEKVAEPDCNRVEVTTKEDQHEMKEEEKIEMAVETSITTKEEYATVEPIEEKAEVPDNEHISPEEDTLENKRCSDGSLATVMHHKEDATIGQSSLDSTDVKKDSPIEKSSVENSDLAHVLANYEEGNNISIDEIANNSILPSECPLEVSSTSVADDKSNVKSTEVPTVLSVTSDEKMLEEAPFESFEYLEDEMNNIVDHIRKPSLQQKELVEDVNSTSTTAIPSIVLIPETPVRTALNETYSPAKQNSSIIDITADTPRPVAAAAAPRTPDTKLTEANDNCSPDKPPEVIEILDSPIVAAFCKQITVESAYGVDNGGSATSTPLPVRPSVEQTVNECEDNEQLDIQFESRKRSLSTSAVDTTIKRNVTFHSPANCTMLVETIDERLMLKSLQDQQRQDQTMESSSKSIGDKLRKPRKRSLSEHKPSEMKRNKTSKLPNFKSIHAKHFDRMESLTEFMNRKETRAKQIQSSCSPAIKLLSQPVASVSETFSGALPVEKKIPSSSMKPFVFKSAGGGIPVPSAGLFVKRTQKGPTAAKATASIAKKPIASDSERMANRLKQFQATFKPKQISAVDTSAVPSMSGSLPSTTVVGERPIEQLRSKQSKILKGVRTNRRFELQMKHRDNLQHQ
uniref:Uncharacterized protein n=1 Tax=Anopheles minimus TaxID=112268 RepID=A0A182W334_9DIPT